MSDYGYLGTQAVGRAVRFELGGDVHTGIVVSYQDGGTLETSGYIVDDDGDVHADNLWCGLTDPDMGLRLRRFSEQPPLVQQEMRASSF